MDSLILAKTLYASGRYAEAQAVCEAELKRMEESRSYELFVLRSLQDLASKAKAYGTE